MLLLPIVAPETISFIPLFLRYHKKMLSLQRDFLKLKDVLP